MSSRRIISAPPYPVPPMTTALKRFIRVYFTGTAPVTRGASAAGAAVVADVDGAHVHGRRLVRVLGLGVEHRPADAVARVGAELLLRTAARGRHAQREHRAQRETEGDTEPGTRANDEEHAA